VEMMIRGMGGPLSLAHAPRSLCLPSTLTSSSTTSTRKLHSRPDPSPAFTDPDAYQFPYERRPYASSQNVLEVARPLDIIGKTLYHTTYSTVYGGQPFYQAQPHNYLNPWLVDWPLYEFVHTFHKQRPPLRYDCFLPEKEYVYDVPKLIRYLEHCWDVGAYNYFPKAAIARILCFQGITVDQGNALIDLMIKCGKTDEGAMIYLAWLYAEKGDVEGTKSVCRQMMKEGFEPSINWYGFMAVAHRQAKEYEKVLKVWEVAKADEDIAKGETVCIQSYVAAYKLRKTNTLQEIVNVIFENDLKRLQTAFPQLIEFAKGLDDPNTPPLAKPPTKPSVPVFPQVVSSHLERFDTTAYHHYQPLKAQPYAPYR